MLRNSVVQFVPVVKRHVKSKFMSLGNAIKLVRLVDVEIGLREGMYECKDFKSLKKFLKSRGYDCTFEELEDAINSLHVQCQTLEQAQYLMHKAELLKYIFQTS